MLLVTTFRSLCIKYICACNVCLWVCALSSSHVHSHCVCMWLRWGQTWLINGCVQKPLTGWVQIISNALEHRSLLPPITRPCLSLSLRYTSLYFVMLFPQKAEVDLCHDVWMKWKSWHELMIMVRGGPSCLFSKKHVFVQFKMYKIIRNRHLVK